MEEASNETERRALLAGRQGDAAAYEEALHAAQEKVEEGVAGAEDWRSLGLVITVGLLGFPERPAGSRKESAAAAIAAFEEAERLAPGGFVAAESIARVAAAMGWWERESAAYLAALQAAPEDCDLRADYVRRLLDEERTDEAGEQLELLMGSHWEQCKGLDRVRVQEYLGRVLWAQQDLEGARFHLTEATREYEAALPADVGAYACPYQALGALYTQSGMEREAARYFSQAAELEREYPDAQLMAAIHATIVGDAAAAQRFSARSVAVGGPSLAESYRARELPYRELMDTIHAQSHLTGALLEMQPPVHGLVWSALSHFGRGRYSTAEALAELGEQVEPRVELLVTRAFVALMKRDTQGAVSLLERADALQPDHGVQVGRGHLAIVARDYQAALALLRPVADDARWGWLSRSPARRIYASTVRDLAHLGLGWVHANQGNHAGAIPEYDLVLAERPDDLLALLGKGNSLAGLRRFEEAEAVFGRVLALSPDNPYALSELGLIRYNRGEDREAEALFERALDAAPGGYTCPHEGLGLVYLRQGRREQARGSFEQAIALGPDFEYRKYNELARIYLEDGRIAEAEALLLKSIENYPWDDEAQGLLAALRADPGPSDTERSGTGLP
jgi:tetratricopeptide (TPR) repeat protein